MSTLKLAKPLAWRHNYGDVARLHYAAKCDRATRRLKNLRQTVRDAFYSRAEPRKWVWFEEPR